MGNQFTELMYLAVVCLCSIGSLYYYWKSRQIHNNAVAQIQKTTAYLRGTHSSSGRPVRVTVTSQIEYDPTIYGTLLLHLEDLSIYFFDLKENIFCEKHCHKESDEVFIVAYGEVELTLYSDINDTVPALTKTLTDKEPHKNRVQYVKSGMWHCKKAITDCGLYVITVPPHILQLGASEC